MDVEGIALDLLELDDPPVMALVVWAANPMASNPDQERIRRGLSRPDLFTVVIENFQTDTADYADILLPGTMQTEHADLHDSYSHLYLQWNEPAVPPPGECLPHTEIFRRLARHIGLEHEALYASDHQLARDALDSPHPALRGITLERLRQDGWARLEWPRPYQPFLDSFPTPSGLFEFRSPRAEAEGVGLLPGYTPPEEIQEPGEQGSFALLSPATQELMNSVYGNRTGKGRVAPTVTVHPGEARRLGLRAGDQVRVRNGRGAFSAELQTSDTVPAGIAASPKGLWPKFSGGSTVNATVAERDADMGRGPVFSDNRVLIEAE